MTKKGGDGGWALLGLAAAFVGLAWLASGRGQNNSSLVPDRLEDQLDLVVDKLNEQFGHQWVNLALDVLQTHIERTVPQVAMLVYAVHAAEQKYMFIPKSGYAKKQVAVQIMRGLRP